MLFLKRWPKYDLKFSGNVYRYQYYTMSGAYFLVHDMQGSSGASKVDFLGEFLKPKFGVRI